MAEFFKNLGERLPGELSFPNIILNILDILFVAFVIFALIRFIRDRRASKLAIGVLIIIGVVFISGIFRLKATYFIFSNIVQVGIIALLILFQPELRSALEKFGGISFVKNITETRASLSKHNVIVDICDAVTQLSLERTGALIVIERNTPLGDIIDRGTALNAEVNVMLIRNVFYNKAPLHDGAMVIKNNKIIAAGCILPMSNNNDIIKDLGTRHRSAIGMSENSDAVVIVVSEETGTISLAVNGQLKRNYDKNTLINELSILLKDDVVKKTKY